MKKKLLAEALLCLTLLGLLLPKVDGASLASAAEKRKASPEAVRALKEAIK